MNWFNFDNKQSSWLMKVNDKKKIKGKQNIMNI